MLISTEIIDRILKLKNFKADVRLAEYWNVSPTTVTNWRTRCTVPLKKIITFCEDEGVSLDYIFTGEGEISLEPKPVDKKTPIYKVGDLGDDQEVDGLLFMAREILNSGTDCLASLAANLSATIRSFYNALETEKRLNKIEMELLEVKEKLKQADRIRSEDSEVEKDTILKKR